MKAVSKFIFWLFGWKLVGYYPTEIKKSVVIAAPHTSNWDYVFSICAFFLMGKRIAFIAKKELFRFPLGWLMRATGGIPLDRSKRNNTVQETIDLFKQQDELALMIAPEGTRGLTKGWKTGFYHVAVGANVPLAMGYLDYDKKYAGIGKIFYPTGNYEKDLIEIHRFYRPITPKYPQKSSLYQENVTN